MIYFALIDIFRLSRCRQLIENVFEVAHPSIGIEARPETADWIVKAAFAYTTLSWKRTPIMTQGVWRMIGMKTTDLGFTAQQSTAEYLMSSASTKSRKEAILTRETLVNYLSGSVDWQEKMIEMFSSSLVFMPQFY
uniref:Uncharacterized protein n=1 Tax=Ditylenchus dipsaci TaxID=166011 RepID=A0A915DW64_9BILA